MTVPIQTTNEPALARTCRVRWSHRVIGMAGCVSTALAMAQEAAGGEVRYPGDLAVALQCIVIALLVAAVCLGATVWTCRFAGLSRRAALPAMGFASLLSIALTWMGYAQLSNYVVWPVVRAWAIVGMPLQVVGHAIACLALVRLCLPETPGTARVVRPKTHRLGAGPRDDVRPDREAPPRAPVSESEPDLASAPVAAARPVLNAAPAATPEAAPDTASAPESRPSSTPRRPVVFISYRRADSGDVTGRIHDRLAASLGAEQVFTDVDSIPLGVDFREHVSGILGRTDCMLAVVGCDWLTAADAAGKRRLDDPADLVRIEIETALARGVPVIPLLVGGAQMPTEADLPASLRGLAFRNGMSVRPNPDFHRDVDRLERQLLGYAATRTR
jgi:hypothetical protein